MRRTKRPRKFKSVRKIFKFNRTARALVLHGSPLFCADAMNLAGGAKRFDRACSDRGAQNLAPERGAQNFNSRARGANRPCAGFLQTEIVQRKNFHAPQRARRKIIKFKKSYAERMKF